MDLMHPPNVTEAHSHTEAHCCANSEAKSDDHPADTLNNRRTDQAQIPHQALKYILSPELTRTCLTREAVDIVRNGSFGIKPSELHVSTKVGNGRFGTVFKGVYNGQACAVKTLKDEDVFGVQYERLLLELSILACIGTHPNLVSFLGACLHENSPPMIVEELVDGPDLNQFLGSKPPGFDLGKPTVALPPAPAPAKALH